MRILVSLVLALVVTVSAHCADAPKKPHVVFLLADDLGWKDVGIHGSEIKTPNLDRLAATGARLEHFYVMPVCSPTRSALMTGRYSMRFGLQTGVVRPWAQYGLPLDERTLPQALKEAGYETAITGKWHLGHFEPAYLPTRRGFDHQYGHYNGALDYYDHTRDGGFDWHRDDKVLREEGYSTNLIGAEAVRLIKAHDSAKPLFLYVPFNAPHAPLEAAGRVPEEVRGHQGSETAEIRGDGDLPGRQRRPHRRGSWKERGLLDNTLIAFSSDNGGPTSLGAANGELRGAKGSLYEGGVRVPAFAVWPGHIKPNTVVDAPLHMVDWYPTLVKLGGGTLEQKHPLDGKDMLAAVTDGKPTPYTEILLNVEPTQGALLVGMWKLIVRGRLPVPEGTAPQSIELYHLAEDIREGTNLAEKEPKRVAEMLARLNIYAREAVPPKGAGKQAMPPGFKAPKVWGEKD